ncbi:MAG: GNAT family N-acetyltransferase [Pauljensenia sp.]
MTEEWPTVRIRDARLGDAGGIAAIYNDAVENTTAVWNETTVDASNRAAWIASHQEDGRPVLVAVDAAEEVLGYATYGDWRAWEGYRHTVEHSVYVSGDHRRAGIGEALMTALIRRARNAHVHVMVAGIEAGNSASIHLHEKLGFARVGLLEQVGWKFGRWLDLAFLQLILDAEH